MKLGLAEILNNASKFRTNKEKVEYLRQNDSRPLQDIIQYAIHPGITWDLPEGAPSYSPNKLVDLEGIMYHEMRRLKYFVNGVGANLSPLKLERMFIEILESVDPKDAELILLAKERKLPKGISTSIIEEVWPGLIPNEQDQKVS